MRSSLETCRCINKIILKHNAGNEYNDDDDHDDDDDDDDVEGNSEQQGVVDFD